MYESLKMWRDIRIMDLLFNNMIYVSIFYLSYLCIISYKHFDLASLGFYMTLIH